MFKKMLEKLAYENKKLSAMNKTFDSAILKLEKKFKYNMNNFVKKSKIFQVIIKIIHKK